MLKEEILNTEELTIYSKLWIWFLLLLIRLCPDQIKQLKLEISSSEIGISKT